MTKYRVDLHYKLETPVGMSGIQYLGNSLPLAEKYFNSRNPGVDTFGEENKQYMVLLSEWTENGYKVIRSKSKRL